MKEKFEQPYLSEGRRYRALPVTHRYGKKESVMNTYK